MNSQMTAPAALVLWKESQVPSQ